MYTPAAFALKDFDLIKQLVRDYGFATLVAQRGDDFEATHVPLLWRDSVLIGHLARANDFFTEGQRVLAVFQGPHAYISPAWYEELPAVPTWNYIAIHVHGRLFGESDSAAAAQLEAMVKQYEGKSSVYDYLALPEDYRSKMQKGIRAFRIEIERVEAKAKLSQNHSPDRVQRVIAQLEKSADTTAQQLAQYMRRWARPD